ncbi:MAG: hypothetical protein JWM68_4696 [Verrucomicrobiales bacterium]|nr:hypothetical protein [Verrucomicrobiales bacterium]
MESARAVSGGTKEVQVSFSFLNPLFWLGVLAVASPIYLHLRRKQPENLLRFAALRFLDDQPEPKQSPRRLRDLLLFALRVLALFLIISAFAWPFIRKANHIIVKESRVYIIDNSLSQQVEDGFVKARDRVANEFGKADRETQVAVVELTANPRVISGFSDSHDLAQQKVRQLQPSFQRGSYLAAFRQANSLLANSLGEKKKIIFLTDNQENQWNENLNTPPFLQDVEVEFPKPGTPSHGNAAVSDPRAQRIFLGEKSLVNFTVQLAHQGSIRSAKLSVRVNGQEVLSHQIDLTDKPENIIFQTQWEAEPSLQLRGEVALEVEGDALAGDNKTYFSLPPVQEGKVAVLAQSSFLKLALSPDIMRGQWATHVIDPTKIAEEVEAKNDAEVLCIESSYLQSTEARKLLWRYLSNARGVFLMVNRVTPLTKGFLKEIVFEILPEEARVGGSAKFQYIFANHPIFHPFTSPDYGNLMEINVIDPIRLRSKDAIPLIFSDKGEPVFFQNPKQPGKLYVSSFGFDRQQTSWPVHPTFIPFLDLCLQNARASDQTPTSFEPGDTYVQTFATNAGVSEVVLKNDKELSRTPVTNGKIQLRLPDQPGLYTLAYEGTSKSEKVIAINPSPKESQLAYVTKPSAIDTWTLPHSPPKNAAEQAKPGVDLSLSSIWQQRIWWWLLLAGLIGLACEAVLSNLKRRSA